MGVYIKDMEMPKDRFYPITVTIYSNGDVINHDRSDIIVHEAVEVPPHGRLGDLDELYSRLKRWYQTYKRAFSESEEIYIKAMLVGVKETPTIIPAEEGE